MSNKTTQAICESMGWDNDAVSIFAPGIGCIGLFDDLGKDTPNGNWLVKALQARLVEEGWTVCNYHSPTFGHSSQARRDPIEFPELYMVESDDLHSEPETIVQLYCKIHGIEVGNE